MLHFVNSARFIEVAIGKHTSSPESGFWNARSECNDTVGKGLRQLAKLPASDDLGQHGFWHESCNRANHPGEWSRSNEATRMAAIHRSRTTELLHLRVFCMADHPIQPLKSHAVWIVGGMILIAGGFFALGIPCQNGYQRASDFAQAVPIHSKVIEQRVNASKKRESELAARALDSGTFIDRHPTRMAGLGISPRLLTQGPIHPVKWVPFQLAAVHAFHRFALPIATSVFLITFGIWSLTSVENRALSIVEQIVEQSN